MPLPNTLVWPVATASVGPPCSFGAKLVLVILAAISMEWWVTM